jgi:hypothetical protein
MAYVMYIAALAAVCFVIKIIESFWLKFDRLHRTSVHVYHDHADYIRVDSTAPWFASTVACHVWGLVVAHLAPLGGSTSPRLYVRELMLKTCNFIDISNTLASDMAIPTTIGGSITTSPPIVAAILRHQLTASTLVCCFDYITTASTPVRCIDYVHRADHATR